MQVKNGLTVLVVDDIEPMRKVALAQLASLNIHRVHTAANGIEALRLLQAHPVDIVLADWNMPEMNGLDLLGALRADARFQHLPFVMITGETERNRIEDAIAKGVGDLLVKPYSGARLSQAIERAMARTKTRPVSVPAPVPRQERAPDAPRLTILIVDDRPDNLHVLANIFKNDYRVQAADSGEKALALCRSDAPPALVLLDVIMPGMDGFEVAQRMRAHPNSENTPVIFVTAATDDATRLKGMTLGAVDFVTKPVDPVQIKLRVDNFMRYVRLRQQLQADYDSMLEAARLREAVEDITRNDMRDPLTTVLSTLQSLLRDKEVARRHALQLDTAEQATLKLLDMINLSTELYRIETGRYVLAPQAVPVADIVRRVVELARAAFADKKLVIALDSDVDVGKEAPHSAGDMLLTYSLLQSLVKNACEASPERGRVTVTLTDTDPLRVVIVNKGVVPQQIRDRFFEKFITWNKTGASGLGAYAARKMAQAQHGQVGLQVSDEHDTTSITVELPRVAGVKKPN
jgi:two-component system sensor histidine kinase/response regulator